MSLGGVWWAPFVLVVLPQKHQVFTFWTDSGTLCFTHGYSLLVLEGPPKWIAGKKKSVLDGQMIVEMPDSIAPDKE